MKQMNKLVGSIAKNKVMDVRELGERGALDEEGLEITESRPDIISAESG